MTYSANSQILSLGQATPADVQAWFVTRGPNYAQGYAPDGQYKPPPPDLGLAIVAECQRYTSRGIIVNSDLVAGQILDETAAWQSTYARERNNPGGIGAINSAPDEALTFATPADGVRAHVAHLLTYAVGSGPWQQSDPRYLAVVKAGWLGIAHVLSDLNGRWAFPGTNYGQNVAALANDLVAHSQGTSGGSMPTPYAQYISGLTDIRSQLPTRTAGDHGPNDRRAMSDKRGLVVHYSGPPNPKRDDPMYMMKMEAQYHVGKNWCKDGQPPCYGDGYMYHVVIDDNGTKYLCRDLEAVLWHCGAYPQNYIALSVHVLIGGDQHATAAQLASLKAVVDDWRASTQTPIAEVWGHQELSSTDCPGTLMAEFVYPYRAGTLGGTTVADGYFFKETGKYVDERFADYFQSRGGVPIFGYPVTGAFTIPAAGAPADGAAIPADTMLVQYYERAILEWHPANPDPYKVLGRRLGADALARDYPQGAPA